MMAGAEEEFAALEAELSRETDIETGQMFGKPCLKVRGKAFVARHKEVLAFKLSGGDHAAALSEEGAVLWDPSGAGRPMKEWIAVPATAGRNFRRFADAARRYVNG